MAATKNRQAGFSLIEILVTLVVLTVGLLGLVGIQVLAQRAELESYQRAQAMVLMSDIVDRINTNRKAATCYAITTDAAAGTKYLGTADSGTYDTAGFSCPALATNPDLVARAELDLQLVDEALLGAAEQLAGSSVGAMTGARACIGFDAAAQTYTIAVAWQGFSPTFSPAGWDPDRTPAIARNCAVNRYGDDTQRRVVWTTILVASLS